MSEPTVNAFLFVLDDAQGNQYDAFLDVVDFQDFSDLQVRYRPVDSSDGKWVYLSSSQNDPSNQDTEINASKLGTAEEADAEFDRLLGVHNESIKKAFGEQAKIPDSGIDRIKWLVKNGTSENNNVLTRSDGT